MASQTMFLDTVFIILLTYLRTIHCAVTLTQISTVYLPYFEGSGWAKQYALVTDNIANAAETSVYDADRAIIYSVGGNGFLNIIDAKDATNLTHVHSVQFHPDFGKAYASDVKLCSGYVFVTVQFMDNPDNGMVSVFSPFQPTVGDGTIYRIVDIEVGSYPAQMQFTKDCKTLVVANEGRLSKAGNGNYYDAEGSISIISFTSEDFTASEVTTLDFQQYNARTNEYMEKGVRYLYRGLDQTPLVSTFSQDLEPKSVTINTAETRAYISLQENNAIAIVDLTTKSIIDLYPLGTKSWQNNWIDASNTDGGFMQQYDIQSFYQPDGMKYFEANGVGYIATANEGAAKHYRVNKVGLTWTEIITGKTLSAENIVGKSVSGALSSSLNTYSKLGGMEFSKLEGVVTEDGQQVYERFYAFGGRSIAIWRADDISLVYESGNQTATEHYNKYLSIFNGHMADLAHTPKEDKDTRSAMKGAEPESLEIADVGDERYIFVGNERTSTIMVYKMSKSSHVPVFESINRAGNLDNSWTSLYENRAGRDVGDGVGDIDPEGLFFIPYDESPNCEPLLLVTGAVSGTVSLYSVNGLPAPSERICKTVTQGPLFVPPETSTKSTSTAPSIKTPEQSTASTTLPGEAPGQTTASKSSPSEAPGQTTASKSPPSEAPGQTTASKSPPSEAPGQTTASTSPPSEAPVQTTASKSPPSEAPVQTTASKSPPSEAPGQTTASKSPPSEAPVQTTASTTPPSEALGQTTVSPALPSEVPKQTTVGVTVAKATVTNKYIFVTTTQNSKIISTTISQSPDATTTPTTSSAQTITAGAVLFFFTTLLTLRCVYF